MTGYIKHKEYKLPNGRTVTAYFNELGHATITIEAMDALFDTFNSSDVRENVRGEWIQMFGKNLCSRCGHKIDIVPTNYCPNCGADMRGEA